MRESHLINQILKKEQESMVEKWEDGQSIIRSLQEERVSLQAAIQANQVELESVKETFRDQQKTLEELLAQNEGLKVNMSILMKGILLSRASSEGKYTVRFKLL